MTKKICNLFLYKKRPVAAFGEIGPSPFLARCKNNDYDGRICYTLLPELLLDGQSPAKEMSDKLSCRYLHERKGTNVY